MSTSARTSGSASTGLREDAARLRDRPEADVLIIGGGINGIATFRELALQGIDVALAERNDYASGASAASSHMVHGGIRYLENGEFRLVKEAVQERNRLIRNAPHYVKPLHTTIPVFSTFSGILNAPIRLLITHGRGKPRERGALLIKIGLVIYDLFSRGGGRVPRHRFQGRTASLQQLPHLNPAVKYTASYYDASMYHPERLALDVLRDGIAAGALPRTDKKQRRSRAHGSSPEYTARASNYLAAIGADQRGVQLRDEITGEEFSFRAKVVVNTSGPWTDLTNSALGTASHFMGGTKGSHIVLDHPDLYAATAGREIFFEHSDGRIVLIYPLKNRVMVGTTDIDADPNDPIVCTDDEIDYFFELVSHVFPRIALERSQIVYTFSGIRPLPRHDDTAPGFVSRDYRIEQGRLGTAHLLSLVGGKWTTFRALAEHLGNETMQLLKVARQVSTRATVIGGGSGFPKDRASRRIWVARHGSGHTREVVESFLQRYGTFAAEVLAALPEQPQELEHCPGYFAEEIAFLATREAVVHLDDILLRRTSLAFVGGLTEESVDELAHAVGRALGWSDSHRDLEVSRTLHILREAHRVIPGVSGVTSAKEPQ